MGEVNLTGGARVRGPAAAFVLDDEAGGDRRARGPECFPVVATVNGYTWRTSCRADGRRVPGRPQQGGPRLRAGVAAGDTVTLELKLDTEPRTVEVPPALAEALQADPEAKASYDGLAFTHRKEFARWIAEAKREENWVSACVVAGARDARHWPAPRSADGDRIA